MKNKLKEWFSIQLVKNPERMVLAAILIFNIVFFLFSAAVISALSLDGTEKMGFVEAAFCTVTMILDAGCIQFVVADIGQSGIVITVFCLVVVLVGMISFTGAVIGYVTNYISSFIEHSNTGKRKLDLRDHFVILNWNSRATEIINDMLYSGTKENVVVLVQSRKEEIDREVEERLADTINKENAATVRYYSHLPFLKRVLAIRKKRLVKKITVIVREGDVFSSKQLSDISLEKAKAVVILGDDIDKPAAAEGAGASDVRGNSHTVKTLMQVADITSAESSANDQKIIVEITDRWTAELVNKIIETKQVDGKCNIVPVRVNQILGQILSQFCLMPELNTVYSELFSNKGAEFRSVEQEYADEMTFIADYLTTHNSAIPITTVKEKNKAFAFYVADSDKDIQRRAVVADSDYKVELNSSYWIGRKNVIILGHNSKCRDIMAGFAAFSNEWKRGGEEIVQIVVVDDKRNLEKMDYYRGYSFVTATVEADVYDKDLISSTIDNCISTNKGDTSILILSDDSVINEDTDAGAFANLIYVRDIVSKKVKEDPSFDPDGIDVIVEIIDPKHHDIVNSYNVNNVVISNRYISKMITQISEFEALFDFYCDILSYDDEGAEEYCSKEVYVKRVKRYFSELPGKTTAAELIRAVYSASVDKEKMGVVNPTIVLGYVKSTGEAVLFTGELDRIQVELTPRDKVILFSSH